MTGIVSSAWRRAALLLVLFGCGATVGAAAGLSLTTDTLGATSISIPRCTTAGVTVLQNLSVATVASVTVSGVPATCGGGALRLTVYNGTSSGSGSATVPAAGGSVTVPLSPAPAVSVSERTDLVIEGP